MGCAGSKEPVQETSAIRGIAQRDDDAPGGMPRVKLVLLGDSGVGKSSLLLRFVRNQFHDGSSKVTIGAAFMSHTTVLPSGDSIKFEIWDTAGQERYRSLAPLYYRGAAAAAVVYDITSTESFAKAKYWVTELQKNASGDIVIVLVGNKVDLESDRHVSVEDGQSYAESNGMLFVESSAKTAAGVAEVFQIVAGKLTSPELPASSLPASDSDSEPEQAS